MPLLCFPSFVALLFWALPWGGRESEYAAWTLVNGYSLNHTTISVHHLGSLTPEGGDTPAAELASAPLHALNRRLESKRIKLNQQGGTVKGEA